MPEPVRVLEAADPVATFLDAHRRDLPVALGTSGSSGAPRAVVRGTGSWVASFPHVSALAGIDGSSRVWVPGPLAATMNLFAAVHATWAGAALADRADAASHAQLTPAALARLLDHGPVPPLTVVVAGDRLSPALAARAVAAGLTVHHYYGAAELSFVAWGAHAEDLRPFPAVAVDVRDGVLWVHSPFLCQGYDGAPGPLRWDGDGYATVGDRGRITADGRLHVDGREGAVTTAGATVHLADVEAVLRPPAAGDVVVLGVPHPRLGQALAVALTDPGDHPTLVRAARSRLEGAARPRLWFHVPALPRTVAGKVDRTALADLLAGAGPTAERADGADGPTAERADGADGPTAERADGVDGPTAERAVRRLV